MRLDTDGLASLREGRDLVRELSRAGLDVVSVSLNAPDAVTYARICPNRCGERAWLEACEFIRSAKGCLPETVASFVALPDVSVAPYKSASLRIREVD